MLQPKGAALLGASLALIAVGLMRIDGVLITLGLAGLLLLLATLVLGMLHLRRLALTIRAPSRVYATAPFDLRLTLHNKRSVLDAFHVDIGVNLSGQQRVFSTAAWTAAQSSSTSHHRVSLATRGAVERHYFTLTSAIPLGLFRFMASGTATHEILVFPRPLIPGELFTQGALHEASNVPGMTAGHAPGEPRGIRPWQPGDAAKHIHWPASARSLQRRRGLRIRENDPPGFHPQHCTILFHSFGTSGELIREDRFDRALSLVCGALRYLRDHGIPVTVLADFLSWDPRPVTNRTSFGGVLTALARASRASDTEAHDLIPIVGSVPNDHSLLIISDMPPDTWAHVLPRRDAVLINVRQHRYEIKRLTSGTPQPRKAPQP